MGICAIGPDLNASAFGRVIDSVIDEVDEDLLDARGIAANENFRSGVALEAKAFVFGKHGKLFGGAGNEARKIEFNEVALDFARIETRQSEQALNNFSQTLHFFKIADERIASGAVHVFKVEDRFQLTAQNGQGRAKFVRSVGDKSFCSFDGILDA